MKLNIASLSDSVFWKKAGVSIPNYDPAAIAEKTRKSPVWVHFGIGNIFRMFIGGLADTLIGSGELDRGIVCVETFDYEVIDKIYRPFDNLSLNVTLKADGSTEKKIIGSLSEAIPAGNGDAKSKKRLTEIFTDPGLQLVSFTVTEKGYTMKGTDGQYLPFIKADIVAGPDNARGAIAIVAAMLFERYKAGKYPISLVSMDNCSHNGEKLKNAVLDMASEWQKRGFVGVDFVAYLSNENRVAFPWTMIDKITPRPSVQIADDLEKIGIDDMQPVITEKKTFIAPFVNAEGPQYLVVEDKFPNGRPALQKAGVYFTDRDTVNSVERMKVTTCLNPLHTALAVYGCVLGYTSIAAEMKDEELKKLVYGIGLDEGMKVVCDPIIINPKQFIEEVLTERFPNAFIPDTPQRIAVDTSQKVGVRYGETIKSYISKKGSAKELYYIPTAIAGWLRYLIGVDDEGKPFELSPDPLLDELTGIMSKVELGKTEDVSDIVRPILSNANIFGIDLYEAGIGEKIEQIFVKEISGPGAVRKTLREI